MSDKLILQALQTAVIAAVAASTDTTIPIKMIGRTLPGAAGGKYWEVVQIPNNIADPTWNDEKQYRGILRLILHWPNDDAGAYPPMLVAQSVASYFTKGRKLPNGAVSVKISGNPDLAGALEAGQETLYPVSVRYEFFQA